jgi:hypothetical protein
MGNIITNTLGKFSLNVTQGVATGLIVTAITTYLLVDSGKKDEKPAGTDTAKSGTAATPAQGSSNEGDLKSSTLRPGVSLNPAKQQDNGTTPSSGGMNAVAVPGANGKAALQNADTPERVAAAKAFKELPPENPTERNLEPTITAGRAKGDSLLRAHPGDEKVQDTNKEVKKDLQDVKKRSDDVFDELDQEVNKK